jgi:hypothetical protein
LAEGAAKLEEGILGVFGRKRRKIISFGLVLGRNLVNMQLNFEFLFCGALKLLHGGIPRIGPSYFQRLSNGKHSFLHFLIYNHHQEEGTDLC